MFSKKMMAIFIFSFILIGCTSYYKMVQSGGVRVARIQAYKGDAASARIDLPAGGVVDLIFVVDDHDCKYPAGVVLNIVARHGDEVADVTVALDEMTWMKRGGECIPVGYVRDHGRSGSMPLRIEAGRHDHGEVHYDFEVVDGDLAGFNIDVWASFHGVYNVDRLMKFHQSGAEY